MCMKNTNKIAPIFLPFYSFGNSQVLIKLLTGRKSFVMRIVLFIERV